MPGTSSRSVLASVTGNPFVFEDGMRKLEVSLGDLITIIEDEQGSVGGSRKGSLYLEKFRSWKEELREMRDPQSRLNLASEEGGGEHGSLERGGFFVD